MNNTKREKIVLIGIVVLVCINSATLLMMWMNKPPFPPPHPPHERPDKIIIERLQLDEKQQKEFEKIKHEHQAQMHEIHQQTNELHQKYFKLLENENVNDSVADVYEKQLASLSEQREEYTFQHFLKLKKICRPDQMTLYTDFIGELSKILSGPKGPPPPIHP